MAVTITPAEQSFSNNFWGLADEGYYALTEKLNSTKKTFEEVKSFYSLRASLHEEFGRKLLKHAKSGIGSAELGTLHDLLSSANKETERMAETHIHLAQKIKSSLEVDLDAFILEHKDKRKLTQTSVEKAFKLKQNSRSYLTKVKEKYEADCAKVVGMQTQLHSLSGREAERVRQKIERLQQEAKIQEQEYRNACDRVADATVAWNRMWKLACDTYQALERKRLEYIQHSFTKYLELLSFATNQEQQSHERLWNALEQYHPAKDIQTFIQTAATGPHIPEAEIFVDYFDDPQKTFQRYTTAHFEVPAELIMYTNTAVLREDTVSAGEKLSTVKRNITNTAHTIPEQERLMNDGLKTREVETSSNTAKYDMPPEQSSQENRKKTAAERRTSLIRKANKPLPPIATATSSAASTASSLTKMHREKLPPLIEEGTIDAISKNCANEAVDSSTTSSSETTSPTAAEAFQKSTKSSLHGTVPDSSTAFPVLVVPEISSLSSNDTSDEDDDTDTKSDRKSEEEEGNISIDPRAKVVFAIGNNMFDLGHLGQESDMDGITGTVRASKIKRSTDGRARRSSTTTRRRPLSADIDAVCNFSYQSLLEELGVLEKKKDDDKTKKVANNEAAPAKTNTIKPKDMNEIQPPSLMEDSLNPEPSTGITDQQPPMEVVATQDNIAANGHRSTYTDTRQTNNTSVQQHLPSTTNNVQQNAVYTNILPPAQQQQQHPYSVPYVQQYTQRTQSFQPSQHQPPYVSHGSAYYPQAVVNMAPPVTAATTTTTTTTTTAAAAAVSAYTHSALGYVNNRYGQQTPPSAMPIQPHQQSASGNYQQQQQPSILFWGVTLTDWHSGKPEELQFNKGTWLGVIEARPDNWYYAVKYDPKMNAFSTEKGFVAQNRVQQVRATTF
ncbi:hypothetical protein BDF20DRAFT_1004693 [Mycotypha africana]|uniref:uncharacterized protein n=1 Tax=Mycotypha africana TaxID=64632 RepID=UPI0023001768|nr:uncharacterized protein BDF20DRAFT_1004693 [Mycotypha africana]KAI8967486.1 hypothetical protein BDF20DRAFT_1004693 [Mycotypha africana]